MYVEGLLQYQHSTLQIVQIELRVGGAPACKYDPSPQLDTFSDQMWTGEIGKCSDKMSSRGLSSQ